MQRYSAWRIAAGLTNAQVGEALGVSDQTSERYGLPRENPRHRRPEFDTAARLEVLSQGLITPANHDDELSLLDAIRALDRLTCPVRGAQDAA